AVERGAVVAAIDRESVCNRNGFEYAAGNGRQRARDRLAPVGRKQKHDAASAAGTADLAAPRTRGRRSSDRRVDLGSGDAFDQSFPVRPLERERAARRFEVSAAKSTLHVDRCLSDLCESGADAFVSLDLPLVHLPVVRAGEMSDAGVVQQEVLSEVVQRNT